MNSILAPILLAAICLYGLSIGPSIVLVENGAMEQKDYFRLYDPVFRAADRDPEFGKALEHYCGFWFRYGP